MTMVTAGRSARRAGLYLAPCGEAAAAAIPEHAMVTWLRQQIVGHRTAAVLACPPDLPAAGVTPAGDWPPDPQMLAERYDADLALLGDHIPRDGFGYFGEEQPVCVLCCSEDSNGLPVGDLFPCRSLRLVAYGFRRCPGWKEAWHPGTGRY